jgi:predicted TIM-barrel fold metal-dependent hydrolase
MVDPDCMVWSSDYPHYDAEWPGALDEMLTRDDITQDLKRAVLGGNAVRWFRLSTLSRPPTGAGLRAAES